MPFAATSGSCVRNLLLLSGQLFAGLCQLTRLNMDTSRSAYSGAALHLESVLLAQTPEQFVTRQADALPWLAVQIAGYTRGWMDIASEAAAHLSQSACNRHDENARHLISMLEGMAKSAREVDATLGVINPVRAWADGAPVARSRADLLDSARALAVSTADAASTAGKRSRTSPGRRQSSR